MAGARAAPVDGLRETGSLVGIWKTASYSPAGKNCWTLLIVLEGLSRSPRPAAGACYHASAFPYKSFSHEMAEGRVSFKVMFWHSSINIAEWLKSDLVVITVLLR
jgi:hypothetical protein